MTTDEKSRFLNALRLPARLSVEQAAVLLGFQKHDIPLLVRIGMLKPLGKPAMNASKYFAACDVESHGRDEKWLSKATTEISKNWRKKNMHSKSTFGEPT